MAHKAFPLGLIIFLLGIAAFGAEPDKEAAKVPVPIDATYKLVFDDEFNGTSVDTAKWNVLSSDTIGGGYEKNQFSPGNAKVADGFLTLLAVKGSPSGRAYGAGFIFTKQSWSYGYWEARMKMPPSGAGMWPAFWMNKKGTYPEIDIFEWLGNTPQMQTLSYHPANDVELTKGFGLGNTHNGPDYSAGFHVYGMLWKPDSIIWYIDGVELFKLVNGEKYKDKMVDVTSTPMETILNSAVGGWNNNVVNDTTVFPGRFQVDYLHIYSSKPDLPEAKPQPGYGGPGDAVGSGDAPKSDAKDASAEKKP